MPYAVVVDDVVIECLAVPDGFTIEESYAPAIRDRAVAVAPEVRPDWVRQPDGSFAPPPAVPAPIAVRITFKSDVFRRCTDQEADRIDAALATASSRMRNLFMAASYLASDAEEYAVLLETATQLFGPMRAAELLAPSL